MTTDAELDNKRRGFWLRMARERANYSQSAVAELLGLSNQSKSTMSAWEAGTREPKLRYLKAMASLYDVPLEWFTDPPMTAYEQLDRPRELAIAALEAEAEDWASQELEAGPGDTAAGAAPPERQTA